MKHQHQPKFPRISPTDPQLGSGQATLERSNPTPPPGLDATGRDVPTGRLSHSTKQHAIKGIFTLKIGR